MSDLAPAPQLASGRRIVFLDVDGTIIGHDGQIPTSASDAIRSARRAGHLVLLATGRSPSELDPRLHEIGFDGAVLSAGAFVRLGERWVRQRAMPEPMARRMVEVFDLLGLDYALQARDAVYPTTGRRHDLRRLLGLDQRPELAPGGALDLEHVATRAPLDSVAKAVFLGERQDAYERVRAALDGEGFTVITGTISDLGTGGGEVSLAGVSKGEAILELLALMGIDPALSIGLGDNNNDLEMLQVTGVGIAMGNGTAAAKAAADEITGSVADGGLAQAFVRHGLG